MLAHYYQTKVSQIKNEAEFSDYYNNLLRNTSTAYSCLDLSTRCRVCLKEEYTSIRALDNPTIIIEALKVFGNFICVSENNHLCSLCYKFIKQAIAFRQIAMRSDQIVQNQIDNEVEIKVELDDDEEGVRDNTKPLSLRPLWTAVEISRDCSVTTENEKKLKHSVNQRNSMKKVNKLQRMEIALEKHLRLHDLDVMKKKAKKKQMVVCKICKKILLSSSMQQHLVLHDPDVKKHVCEVCGKTFTLWITLLEHQKRHNTEFIFKCQQCPYRARYVYLLKSHMLMHTQTLKYLCTQCPARFNYMSNLKRHMWKHEEPQFKCGACNRAFHNKTLVQEHYVGDHLGNRNYVCNICGNTFASRRNMVKHQRAVHKRPLISIGRMPSYLIAEKLNSNTD